MFTVSLQAFGTAAGTLHLLEYGGREWRRLQPHKGKITDLCTDEVSRKNLRQRREIISAHRTIE